MRGRKGGTIGGCQKSQRPVMTMRGRTLSNRPLHRRQLPMMRRLPRSTRCRSAEATKFRLTMRTVLRLQLRRVSSPLPRNRRKSNHPLSRKKPGRNRRESGSGHGTAGTSGFSGIARRRSVYSAASAVASPRRGLANVASRITRAQNLRSWVQPARPVAGHRPFLRGRWLLCTRL